MSNTLLPCPFCGGEFEIITGRFMQEPAELYQGIHMCNALGRQIFTRWCDTEKEVIELINRRAHPENKPLTLDELRQMDGCNDGTPIWIEPTGKYEGVWTAAWYIWPWDTKDFEIDTYADAWLAYRSKPKEEV